MDMAAKFQDQRRLPPDRQARGDGLGADRRRPPASGAARAGYRDLDAAALRLPAGAAGSGRRRPSTCIRCRALVDALLAEVAPRGIEGERLRKQVLRLEREIRAMRRRGREGHAVGAVGAPPPQRSARGGDETVGDRCCARRGDALPVDGEVVDCDPRLPARLSRRRGGRADAQGAANSATLVDRLMRKLSDILRAAFARSAGGPAAAGARGLVGGAHADVFDFAAMSKLVARSAPKDELPPARRAAHRVGARRARRAALLRRSAVDEPAAAAATSCSTTARPRPRRSASGCRALVEIVKAIAIAELEADGATTRPTTMRSSSATTSTR